MIRLLLSLFLVFSISSLFSQQPIKDSVTLIRYAEPILFNTYGKEHILAEKPYIISLKKGTWIMDGSMPGIDPDEKGGTFHIEIRAKDRKVIKLIHL